MRRLGTPGSGTIRALAVLGAYVLLFAGLMLPWLQVADHAVPAKTVFTTARDSRLCIWILARVLHAFVTPGVRVIDGNINHPAPAQLTSSEQLLSTELLFAPLFWLTANPVLATNLVTFLTYPLAAFAMDRLLRALGCSAVAAAVGGLVFALGPLRVPANLPTLQYPNLYLPLLALSLVRLRQRPGGPNAAWLGVALGVGLLSGYYMALMLFLTGAAWGAIELARSRSGRWRFVALALGATLAACVPLGVAARPYLGRPEGVQAPFSSYSLSLELLLLRFHWWSITPHAGRLACVLAVAGLLGLAARGTPRRLSGTGLTLVVLALAMPFVKMAENTWGPGMLRFFRYPQRLLVLEGFGLALLAAAALETGRRWLGARFGTVAVALVGVAILATRGPALMTMGTEEIGAAAHAPLYRGLAPFAHGETAGPLLELPWRFTGTSDTEPDSMVGSTYHWLPLVGGFTGYVTPHRPLLEAAVTALPAAEALDDIVDMTHARWLLLRPREEWRRPDTVDRLLRLPGVAVVRRDEGWTLARLTRAPAHPSWYAAIAGGWQPGRTALGTALAPLAPGSASAELRAREAPSTAYVGARPSFLLEIHNTGTAGWPAARPAIGEWSLGERNPGPDDGPFVVRLTVRWGREGFTDATSATVPLRRDVPAGESIVQEVTVQAPRSPGLYAVEFGIEQVDGPPFGAPGGGRLVLNLPVVPRPAPGSSP